MSNFLGHALAAGLLTRATEGTEVYLVRHGQQVRFGIDSPESGSVDSPLSDLGREQARAVGRALSQEGLDAVYSSNLVRAYDTGRAIAEPYGFEVTVDPRIKEIEIFRDVPAEESFEEHVGEEMAAEASRKMVETLKWDALPLSEGSEEFRTRVHTAIWEIARGHQGQKIAIACHGGVVNGFLAQEYGLDRDFLFRPAHAGVTKVRFSSDRAIMLTGNDVHHLEPAGLLSF